MDEQTLIERTLSGDERAFEELTRLHERHVFALCRQILQHREDAEDACIETFVRAYQHLSRLRPQPTVAPWLRRTATNLCISILRRRATRREELLPESQATIDGEDPERTVSLRDDARLLRLCLEELSPSDRTLLTLRYVEDRSLEEVSELMRRPRALLKVQLHRARKRLEKLYEDKLQSPVPEAATPPRFLTRGRVEVVNCCEPQAHRLD